MPNHKKSVFKFLIRCVILPAVLCSVQPPGIDPSILTQNKSIGDCHACKIFIDSFKKGLDRTARGKYEGGDAAWEEEKLQKSYKRSEMRLIDIQDGICKESEYSVQCFYTAEKAEEFIEEWWGQNPEHSPDLYTYICIDKLKVCCPPGHYGRDCKPCQGDLNNLCNGNGKCRGDGTRKGIGTCLCHIEYTGENCDECATNFFKSQKDGKSLCSPCHVACSGGCREWTRKDCVACKTGFFFDQDDGCVDVNECDDPNLCKIDQFCMNSLGSFKCVACDKSCKGCYGDGPDSCRRCAKGYSKKGEFCIQDREEEFHSYNKLTVSRYITYVGLIIATCILFPTSKPLGGFIGATVVWYIICAEYYCVIYELSSLYNLKELIVSQLFT